MTLLSVNVNKVATLRNSRGKNQPDVIQTALDLVKFGAQGITVHPRPDERHIRKGDVYALKEVLAVELNVEGYPSEEFLRLVCDVRPAQATLVPDPPHAITSNAGWDVSQHVEFLLRTCERLQAVGIRTSLFLDPFNFTAATLAAVLRTGTDRVELYTEAYADAYPTPQCPEVLARYVAVAKELSGQGVELNAGHDLNLHNLATFAQALPRLNEVSIGHALVCDALYLGWEKTIAAYLAQLKRPID